MCGISASVDNTVQVIARRVGKPRGGNRSNTVAFPTNPGHMANPAIAEAAENAAARKRVQGIAESMLNTKTLAKFDDGKGSRDFVRWRREMAQVVQCAGVDFSIALHTQRAIVPVDHYTEDRMLLDTVEGVLETTMPQMRQAGLLALMRNALPDGGESLDLIEHCVHAGGHIFVGGYQYAQALMTLDRRWLDGGIAKDLGVEARSLYSTVWPEELSVDAYNEYFNLAVSRAAKIGQGQGPLDDSEASMVISTTFTRSRRAPRQHVHPRGTTAGRPTRPCKSC